MPRLSTADCSSDLEIFSLQTGIERLLLGHSQPHKKAFQKGGKKKKFLMCREKPVSFQMIKTW